MSSYLLIYHFVDDYLQRRAQFRAEHLRLAWVAFDRGELLLAGALADPADTGVLLFRAESDEIARQFAAADPYVRNGLVERYEIRQWDVVVGSEVRESE